MKRVAVGMSGGVDSSVAAFLLQREGYEVVGVTFRFIDDFDSTDAENVCKSLGIKHFVLDYRKQFKEKVIDKFIKDYKSGITPNPCILCNKYVKFKFLYDCLNEFDCDYIATGHYAKVIDGKLYKSEDVNKDQTYFLCEVTKEQLSKVLFPLEGIDKSVVREIARKNNLEVFNKKDSTDVCFISDTFNKYISGIIKKEPGDVIDVVTNKVIAKHDGLSKYTIGQRRGLNIGGTKDRMFVVGKDINKNILYIATGNDNSYLISDSCLVEELNWTSDKKVNKCTAKFRYRQEETEVELEFINDEEVLVKYPQGVKSVTPGQACVFYDGEYCLGGGIIKEVRKNNKKLWYLL